MLGIASRGFFVPYRHAAAAARPRPSPAYPEIAARLRREAARLRATLAQVQTHARALRAIDGQGAGAARWDQDWFARLDAAVAYSMVRTLRPRRIVEIGSGHSTRFLARARADGDLDTVITAIDPDPRADLGGVGVEHVARTVQEVGLEAFRGLGDGDIVFIDSSHVAMPGTDCDLIYARLLPRLAPGVTIHIHDVFLPYDYPAAWAWRGYNEQLLAAQLVQDARGFEVLFASRFVMVEQPDLLAGTVIASLPLVPGALETSLWLRKRT